MSMTYTTTFILGACFSPLLGESFDLRFSHGGVSALAMPKDAAMVRMGINLGSPEEEAKVKSLSNSGDV